MKKNKTIEVTNRNGAKIVIPAKLLLEWLQFGDGVLHSIKLNDDYLPALDIALVIEHPDLPSVPPNEMLRTVTPQYTSHYGEGNLIGIERTDPPKGKSEEN